MVVGDAVVGAAVVGDADGAAVSPALVGEAVGGCSGDGSYVDCASAGGHNWWKAAVTRALLRHGASIDVADGRGRLLRDLPTSNNVKRVLKRSTTLPAKDDNLKENANARVKRASSAPISVRA